MRLGLHALALTDHDGFYGVVSMAEAAEGYERVGTVFGAELSLGLDRPAERGGRPGGQPPARARPQGGGLPPARRRHHLRAAGRREKGRPVYDLDELAERAGGHWSCSPDAARARCGRRCSPAAGTMEPRPRAGRLDRLVELFGQDNVVVELFDHGNPLDSGHNDVLAELAARRRLRVVATGNVHYATPEQHRVAAAVAAVRARRSLDELDGWLPASGSAHLRSGAEMAARFARYPGAVETTVELADELAFRCAAPSPSCRSRRCPRGTPR